MSTPAAHVLPSCTADELHRDFGDWILSTTRTFPKSSADRCRQALPPGSLEVPWNGSSPASRRLRREIEATAAGASHLLLIAASAAEQLRQELPRQSRLLGPVCRLLDGHAIGDASRLALLFDDGRHPCLGLIADDTDRRTWSIQLHRIAAGNVPFLITGETGTGKELFAQALQRLDPSRREPWVAVNCAAFSEGLLESELFGHVRGAFTGATTDRPGLFESAHGGTLFLDEIGELPRHLQAKLLRILEDRRIRPLGGTRTRAVDCRILAATNRDLTDAVRRNEFRPDLYHRLRGVQVTLPPLRDRPRLLRPAVEAFLARAFFRFGRRAHLSEAAHLAVASHGWPGNFRELRQIIDGAILSAEEETIEPSDLGLPGKDEETEADLPTVDVVERAHILRALDTTEGNIAAAARILGLTRQSLRRRLFRHRLLPLRRPLRGRRLDRCPPERVGPTFASNGPRSESPWSC